MPPSGRTRQQQQAIDGLKQVNVQQRGGVERQQRELADIERLIDEQTRRIAELMAS